MLKKSSGLTVSGSFNIPAQDLIGEIIRQTKICQLPLIKTTENDNKATITEFSIDTHPLYIVSYFHGTIEEKNNESLLDARISAPGPLGVLVNLLFQKMALLLVGVSLVISLILYSSNSIQTEQIVFIYSWVALFYLVAGVIIFQNIYLKTKIDNVLKTL